MNTRLLHICASLLLATMGCGCRPVAPASTPSSRVPALVADVAHSRLEEVKERLKRGESPNVQTEWGHTPVYSAVTLPEHDKDGRHIAMLTLLLEAGAEPDTPDRDGRTALHVAAMLQNVEMVKLLVVHGADVNKADACGETTIMFAAGKGSSEIVEYLFIKGANPNARSDYNGDLLTHAKESGNTSLIRRVKAIMEEKGH